MINGDLDKPVKHHICNADFISLSLIYLKNHLGKQRSQSYILP